MTKLPLFPTLGKTVLRSFKELYNSMGFSILISCICFIGYLPVLFLLSWLFGIISATGSLLSGNERYLGFGIILLAVGFWNGLVIGPLTTGFYSLYQFRKTDYPSVKIFFQLFKKFYWRSAGVHWLFSLAAIVLVFNITIAFRFSNIFLVVAGVLSAYILLFISLAPFYFHPLIYLENSFKKVIKKSFLLVLDNLGLSFWFGAFLGLMLLISIGLVFPLFLLYAALLIYVTDNGFEPIYQKYDE